MSFVSLMFLSVFDYPDNVPGARGPYDTREAASRFWWRQHEGGEDRMVGKGM